MANTTWNPADRNGNVVLSGTNNLTVTLNGFGAPCVRSVDKSTTGKAYFEWTLVNASGDAGIGLANGSIDLSTVVNFHPAGAAALDHGGALYVNNTLISAVFATMANGNVACVAVDLTANLIWFRNGAAGDWNNGPSNNPATGVGGYSISAITTGGVFAFCAGNNPLGVVITANFGDSAFSGAVPAGFTSGFPAGGGAAGAAQARAMVLA